MHITLTMTAGQRIEFVEPGDFFRLMAATATITVEYYKDGKELAEGTLVSVGYAEKFNEGSFDKIAITSTAAQTLTFATRLGNEVLYDTPPNGQVTVTNTAGAFTQAQKTVTNASATMLTANTARRYLLIQNNDATGDIYVTTNGVAATTTNGIKIRAGGSYEIQGFAPTGAINAIGSIASNANIVAVEG
jgi:hypothetical protein